MAHLQRLEIYAIIRTPDWNTNIKYIKDDRKHPEEDGASQKQADDVDHKLK